MIRVLFAMVLALISVSALAGVGGHGNALTPFTVGFDGWTVVGSTSGTGQANCGTGTPNNNPGTCWFYVASTGTDGANVCTNIASPCLTIEHARVQLRTGKPDHMNILCGDTIPFVTIQAMAIQNVGKSATEPAVITTYCPSTAPSNTSGTNLPEGSGPRPNILSTCNNPGMAIYGLTGNYVMVSNLRFYNNVRDPGNNPGQYNPSCNGNGNSGFSNSNASLNWVLLEGNTFEYFTGNGFTNDPGHPGINWLLRRNIINGTWAGNGIFMEGQTGTVLFEENILCNNGWNADATTSITSASYNSGTGNVTLTISANIGNVPNSTVVVSGVTGTGSASVNGTFQLGALTSGTTLVYPVGTGLSISGLSGGNVIGAPGAASFHNLYNNYGPDTTTPPFPLSTQILPSSSGSVSAPMILTGNLFCNGINNDQFRAGGVAQFNAWVGDPGALSIGGPIAEVTDNLITEIQNYYVSNTSYGSGFTTGSQNIPSFVTIPTRGANGHLNVSNNIFTHNVGTSNVPAITIQTGTCNAALQQCTIPSTNFAFNNNLACNWPGGMFAKNSEGAIISLNSTFTGGTGATPGIYPGTVLTGGAGSGAIATVTVGSSGAVSSVNIQQFGGVGALFTISVPNTTTATITGMQAGGIIIPNSVHSTTGLIEVMGGGANDSGRTIVAQLTSTDPGGALMGNGTYQLNAALNYSGGGQAYVRNLPSTIVGPNQGAGYAVNDTLGITAGSLAGQVPGLSGFSIQVASVAANIYSGNTVDSTLACSALGGPNPSITVGSYNASIGGTATTAAYIASALAKSKSDANGKSNWPYKLSTYAVVNAFKSGFGQTPNAPVY